MHGVPEHQAEDPGPEDLVPQGAGTREKKQSPHRREAEGGGDGRRGHWRDADVQQRLAHQPAKVDIGVADAKVGLPAAHVARAALGLDGKLDLRVGGAERIQALDQPSDRQVVR